MSADELDRLDPSTGDDLKLSDGTVVVVQRLRTRQFFKMLRIVTVGGGHILPTLDLDPESEGFAETLVAALVFSIPEAEDQVIDFLRSMVALKDPAEREGEGRDRESQAEADERVLGAVLENPDMDDTVSIIERVVQNEIEDIKALGKRLGGMMKVAQKTGQAPQQKAAKKKASAA